jgi:hypothetical protein
MARFVAGLYIALVLALVVSAVAIWTLRCEGFGCMSVGIAWLGWVAVYVAVLVAGLTVRALSNLGKSLSRATSAAVLLQVGGGAALVLLWAASSAA